MIEQFDGYFDLPDRTVDFDEYGFPLVPGDVNLPAGETQLIKQADVVLLMYLFGDRFDQKVKHRNFRYYLDRDTQRSSLSPNTYAIVGLDVGEPDRAYMAFRSSAWRDLRPTTDALGIHAACLGGTWQAVVNGFAGMRLRGDVPTFKPWLPPQWNRVAFRILWRGSLLQIEITRARFTARVLKGKSVDLNVRGETVHVTRRESTVNLEAEWTAAP